MQPLAQKNSHKKPGLRRIHVHALRSVSPLTAEKKEELVTSIAAQVQQHKNTANQGVSCYQLSHDVAALAAANRESAAQDCASAVRALAVAAAEQYVIQSTKSRLAATLTPFESASRGAFNGVLETFRASWYHSYRNPKTGVFQSSDRYHTIV